MKLVFGKSSNGKQPAMVIAGALVMYSGAGAVEQPAPQLAAFRYVLNDRDWQYIAADGAWKYVMHDKDWTQ